MIGEVVTETRIGKHPDDGQSVSLYSGRYGPYVKHGKVNATLPKGTDPAEVTLEAGRAVAAPDLVVDRDRPHRVPGLVRRLGRHRGDLLDRRRQVSRERACVRVPGIQSQPADGHVSIVCPGSEHGRLAVPGSR